MFLNNILYFLWYREWYFMWKINNNIFVISCGYKMLVMSCSGHEMIVYDFVTHRSHNFSHENSDFANTEG